MHKNQLSQSSVLAYFFLSQASSVDNIFREKHLNDYTGRKYLLIFNCMVPN